MKVATDPNPSLMPGRKPLLPRHLTSRSQTKQRRPPAAIAAVADDSNIDSTAFLFKKVQTHSLTTPASDNYSLDSRPIA